MNKLLVPPSPSWYTSSVMSCAPDNTLVYGGYFNLVVIKETPDDQPNDVKILPTYCRIICVKCNPNWGNPEKVVATFSEINTISIWDVEKGVIKITQDPSLVDTKQKLVGGDYAGNDKIISAYENGLISIWRIGINQVTTIKTAMIPHDQIMCISTNPHVSWMIALGTKKGYTIVMDLRKNGSVIHKLKNLPRQITGLSWCPTPFNIYGRQSKNIVMKPECSLEGIKFEATKEWDQKMSDLASRLQAWRNSKGDMEQTSNAELDTVQNEMAKLSVGSQSKAELAQDDYHKETKQEETSVDTQKEATSQTKETPTQSPNDDSSAKTPKDITSSETTKSTTPTEPPRVETKHEDPKEAIDKIAGEVFQNEIQGLDKLNDHKNKSTQDVSEDAVETSKIIIPEYVKKNKPNPWVNLVYSDDDELPAECPRTRDERSVTPIETESSSEGGINVSSSEKGSENTTGMAEESTTEKMQPKILFAPVDFAEECRLLREKILAVAKATEQESEADDERSLTSASDTEGRKILKAKRIVKTSDGKEENVLDEKQVKDAPVGKEELLDENMLKKNKQEKGEEIPLKGQMVKENEEKTKQEMIHTEEEKAQSKGQAQGVKGNVPARDSNETKTEVLPASCKTKQTKTTEKSKDMYELPLNEITNFSYRRESLLASIHADGVCIWRAGGDGRLEKTLQHPTKPNSRRKSHPKQQTKDFGDVHWIAPGIILAATPDNQVIMWNLLQNKTPNYKLVHRDHNDTVFALTSNVVLYPEADITKWIPSLEELSVWSHSRDRYILQTSLGAERKTLCSYPTFGSNIHCLTSSPIDPTRIAISAFQGKSYIWDLSRPNIKNIVMAKLQNKANENITCMSYHPEKETCLAFATSHGQIRLVNTSTLSAAYKPLQEYFKTEVHKIEWAPVPYSDKWALYAIAEGKLIYYEVDKTKQDSKSEAVLLQILENEVLTNFSWKPDYSMLVVGTKSGRVSIFSRELVHLTTVYSQTKSVYRIKWHPQATAEDEDKSPFHMTFVTTSNKDLCLYNAEGLKPDDMDQSSDRVKVKHIAQAHSKVIRDFDWSPYENGKLISVGEEGVAKIWNVETQENVGMYVNDLLTPMSVVMWSPLDKNLVLLGSKLEALAIVDISECPVLPEEEIDALRKKRTQYVSKVKMFMDKVDEVSEATKEVSEKATIIVPKGTYELAPPAFSTKTTIFHHTSYLQNEKPLAMCSVLLQKLKDSDEVNAQGKEEQTSLEEEINDEQLMVEELGEKMEAITSTKAESMTSAGNNTKEQVDKISASSDGDWGAKFFQSRETLLECMDMEQMKHRQLRRFAPDHLISLFRGDIGDNIRAAIQSHTVTPWLLSIAAMASPRLWQEACETYAKQISDSASFSPLEAASYYIACHKIEEAINCLVTAKRFKESVALAKLRLAPDDPIITDILTKWATFACRNGQYETAAQCYISMRNYDEAAKILARRREITPECLEVIRELSRRSPNKNLLESVEVRYFEENKEESTGEESSKENSTKNKCAKEEVSKAENVGVEQSEDVSSEMLVKIDPIYKIFEEDLLKKKAELLQKMTEDGLASLTLQDKDHNEGKGLHEHNGDLAEVVTTDTAICVTDEEKIQLGSEADSTSCAM